MPLFIKVTSPFLMQYFWPLRVHKSYRFSRPIFRSSFCRYIRGFHAQEEKTAKEGCPYNPRIETSARIRRRQREKEREKDSRFGGNCGSAIYRPFFRPDGPRVDGWITRKLFRSERLVAFTLRRNVPHNSRLSFFVRARARSILRDRAQYVSPEEKHCSVKRASHDYSQTALSLSLSLVLPLVMYKQNRFAYCRPRLAGRQ